MNREKKENEAVEATKAIEFTSDINVSLEVREEIMAKAAELKEKNKLRKIFVVIVEGEDEDDKPLYIAYLRRPNIMQFSQYMSFVQKDIVQANKMLASNVFIAGDKELIDDEDLFLYGTMSQLSKIIDSRNADLVKR